MAAHRNHLKENTIVDNGAKGSASGIRIRGETDGLVLEGNAIRDTRDGAAQTQTTGILIEHTVGSVTMRDNQIAAKQKVDDQRPREPNTGSEQ